MFLQHFYFCCDRQLNLLLPLIKAWRTNSNVNSLFQMGNVLNKFGCSKHLEFPNGVMVNDRQEIFISDNRAHCVKVFNYEGVYQRQIGGEGKPKLDGNLFFGSNKYDLLGFQMVFDKMVTICQDFKYSRHSVTGHVR